MKIKTLRKTGKKALSLVLAFLLAAMLFPAAALTVFADDSSAGGGEDPSGATTWTSPTLNDPASFPAAVAGVNWGDLYDPSVDIAAIQAQYGQLSSLIQSYAEAKENPNVVWVAGDPGDPGAEIDQLATAYNAYYGEVWDYVRVAKAKTAYDASVSNFSNALANDIWNGGINYSISPAPSSLLAIATMNAKYNSISAPAYLLSTISAQAGAPMELSIDTLGQFTSYQAANAISERAVALSALINGIDGNQLQVVLYDNRVATNLWGGSQDYQTTITTNLSGDTKAAALNILNASSAVSDLLTDGTDLNTACASAKAVFVDAEGTSVGVAAAALAAFSNNPDDETASSYEGATDKIAKAVKKFTQAVKGTLSSDSIITGDSAKLLFSTTGVSKEIRLAGAYGIPGDAESGAFTQYVWDITLAGEGAGAFTWTVDGDALTVSSLPGEKGSATFTVELVYQDTGSYEVSCAPLVFAVEAVDSVSFVESGVELTADSTNGDQYVNLPEVLNAHGTLSYALAEGSTIGEAWGRIALEGNRVKVAKDANAGAYEFVVVATDVSDAGTYTAETTVKLAVTNGNDAAYLEKLRELQDIEDQITVLMAAAELLPEDSALDPTYLAALNAFANITDPYEAMWNNGNPTINTDALNGLKDALNALKSIESSYASIIDLAVGVIDLAGGLLSYLPSDKDTMVNGYTVDFIFFTTTIPSLANTYANAVAGVWDLFQGQLSPVTNLIDAYTALQDFVLSTDYAGVDNLGDVNTYIQTLNKKYVDLDNALVAFNESDSIFRDLADLVLSNTTGLLNAAFGLWSDDANGSLAELVAGLVDTQIQNEELHSLIAEGLVTALDALRTVVQDSSAGLAEIDVSLAALVGYSAQIRGALGDVAAVSAFAVGSYTYLKNFNLYDYDFAQLALLDDYLTRIYEGYLASFDPAVGPTGDPAVAEALRQRINDARDRLLANGDVQTAIAVYNDIVDIYVFVNEAIAYFNSDQPEKDLEAAKQALCDRLEQLADQAATAGKDWLAQRINALIEQVRAATLAELANINSQTHELIRQTLEELAPYIEELEGAYADAVAAYQQAKAIYEEAVNWYQRAVQARELIEQIIAKAQEFDYEDFLNKQLDRLEQLLHAYIQQELDEAKRAVIEALIEKVHELRAEIASSQTVADIKAYLVKAEELWAQAQVIFNTAVGDYHVIRPYVEQAISFGTFVAEYDFEGVTSLEEANVFLQELAAQYGELHSDFAGLANLSPGAQAIIDWTLQWTDDALLAALPYIEGIVDWQLANRLEINTGNIQLDTLIRDIARQTAESGLSTLKSIIENAPDATLAGLIAKSGQLNDVLRALAEVGNLAVSAKTWTVATIAEVLAQLETLKAQVAVFTQEAREHIEQLINNAKAFLEQAIAEGKQFISDLYEDIAAGAEQLIADLHKIRDYVENYLAEGKEELTARVNELIAQIEQASEEIAVLIPVIEDRLAELWADAVAAAAQAAEDAAEGVQLAVAAIDAAIRSIPDPRLLSTELALATDAQSAVLATNYEDFFATVAQLLGQYLDLDYVMPAYVTAALPQGFTLSADGQLSVDPAILVQTVEEYHNDTFTRTFGISIAVKTGIKEIDDLLANLGIPALVEQDVMVALALEPLDNPPVPPVSTLKGDANCDGFVAADDANLVARFVARLDTLTDQGKINGDMNDSGGNPTIGDAILIARRVAGFVD